MSRREHVIRGEVESEHIVQLFDTSESLGSGVAAFLAQGLAEDGKALVVARPRHVDAILKALGAAGYDVAELIANEALTVVDARVGMSEILRAGLPDPGLFEATIGDLVHRLAATSVGQLHIYGEIVDLLAEEGSFAAVDALEGLWNELAATESFSVLCGYASGHFAAPRGGERLQAVCRLHSRIERSSDDMLGEWLLNSTSGGSAV